MHKTMIKQIISTWVLKKLKKVQNYIKLKLVMFYEALL